MKVKPSLIVAERVNSLLLAEMEQSWGEDLELPKGLGLLRDHSVEVVHRLVD